METVALHGPRLGIGRLCAALVLPRATYYRHLEAQAPAPRPTPTRALSAVERQEVLAVLHEPRFVDLAPAEVHARLLDEGRYLCSAPEARRIPVTVCRSRHRIQPARMCWNVTNDGAVKHPAKVDTSGTSDGASRASLIGTHSFRDAHRAPCARTRSAPDQT
jgi:hypothetical protein